MPTYGLLHEDLFFETSGEFLGVWEALKPVVPTFRERFVNKQILVHLEEAAKRYEAWSEHRNPRRDAAIHATDARSGSISGQSLIRAAIRIDLRAGRAA